MSTSPVTHFAPAERASAEEIEEQVRALGNAPVVRTVLNNVPVVVMVLNHQRQAVYANSSLLDLLDIHDESEILGKRPGEILQCVHSDDMPAGCGTSEACSTCGAVQAILDSYEGKTAESECRITRRNGGETESVELRVSATLYEIEGQEFTVFSLSDISNEKRRDALERIFFHDISNTAGSVIGFAQMLGMVEPDKREDILAKLLASADRLNAEIAAQKQLLDAENGRLELNLTQLHASDALRDLCDTYAAHPLARGIEVRVAPKADEFALTTDVALVYRVLGNMLKNAIEASSQGDCVTIGSIGDAEFGEFWVHNPATMPRDAELQVFQRSFSTKGRGRGLGTYSMRLLTENYLRGAVAFATSAERGTTFRARYPLVHPEYAAKQ